MQSIGVNDNIKIISLQDNNKYIIITL